MPEDVILRAHDGASRVECASRAQPLAKANRTVRVDVPRRWAQRFVAQRLEDTLDNGETRLGATRLERKGGRKKRWRREREGRTTR